MRYTSFGFELLGGILLMLFLGMKLDEYVQNKNKWWTIGLTTGFVVFSLVKLIVQLTRNQDK